MDLGIALFAGEAEGRLDDLLRAAYRNEMQPLYNFMKDLPGLEGAPCLTCRLDVVRRTSGARTSFDAGRGCPFLCSFCTIINVQGRKSRSRNADDVEQLVRANLAQGVHNFFITDDNLARNQNWEAIFDRLIRMREVEHLRIRIVAQVDTMSHKIPGFIDKAGRAGVNRVFIGLESINPDALKAARKGQNQITEYRAMLQAWHRAGALTYAGYILGFPGDTPDSIERDIAHHPARARDRPARVLHPDAAARLRRSPEASSGRRRDGARHEQVRPRARQHAPCHDVGRGAARDLPQGLGPLLFARARRTGHPQSQGVGLRSPQHDAEAADLSRGTAHREGPSAGRRPFPAQVPPRSSAGDAVGKPLVFHARFAWETCRSMPDSVACFGNTGASFAGSSATRPTRTSP